MALSRSASAGAAALTEREAHWQTEIKAAIEKANSAREGGRGESKGIVEQLKAIRARIKAASQEREEAFQQLREMTQSRQAQQKSLQDLRRSLKFEDVGQVESRVQELEAMIEQGQCANLREEKALMQEIKQLNATKAVIVQYQSQKAGQSDDSETKVTPHHRAARARAPRRVQPRAPALESSAGALRSSRAGRVLSSSSV